MQQYVGCTMRWRASSMQEAIIKIYFWKHDVCTSMLTVWRWNEDAGENCQGSDETRWWNKELRKWRVNDSFQVLSMRRVGQLGNINFLKYVIFELRVELWKYIVGWKEGRGRGATLVHQIQTSCYEFGELGRSKTM